jgi:hypothetical protein
MAIQFERRPMESLETLAPPQRPARKNQFSQTLHLNHQINKIHRELKKASRNFPKRIFNHCAGPI